MSASNLEFGESYPDIDASRLQSELARRTIAILPNRQYELVSIGRYESSSEGLCDVIVADCTNEGVASKNSYGIQIRERLALVFPHNTTKAPQVRALRDTFPTVPHLNYVPTNEPASLCMYFEAWSTVRRTWTPQKYLRRLLWWLSETSRGALHREDQPLEQIYFNSPNELVLVPDFFERIKNPGLKLVLASVAREDGHTIRTAFRAKGEGGGYFVPLLLTLDPATHGRVEKYPGTLGELHDQLVSHGSSLIAALPGVIEEQVDEGGVERSNEQACLLILCLPVRRTAGTSPEGREVRGYIVSANLATLGKAVGTLHPHHDPKTKKERFYRVALLGSTPTQEWQGIRIQPVDVKHALTREFARRASGIPDETADQPRVLAGLGALGSRLADTWARGGWGDWTYIDADHVQPHNLVRHDAKDPHVGCYKTDAVQDLSRVNYQEGYYTPAAIHEGALKGDSRISEALERAHLFVDATTTLEVPREFARREAVPRCVSVFLSPSGCGSVLLLEDEARRTRLDALEAQYYRAILNALWGDTHLAGNRSHLGVGAGCRDVSLVMSDELVRLHAAILARQVRLLSSQPEARIRIWRLDEPSGSVEAIDVPVCDPCVRAEEGWTIASDSGVESKLAEYRRAHAPNETGGVILGYVDHSFRTIVVVDVLPAPPDSHEDPNGFIRGTEQLKPSLNEVGRRTAKIVNYVGEWHSHPPFHSAAPSSADRLLMKYLADELSRDGEPVLMIIVGSEGETRYLVREEAWAGGSLT